MDTKVNYTIVGLFVIILISALTLAIIWLSSGFSFEKYSSYLVYMQESVSGLNIDSAVEFNGVGVGSVKSIELNQKNPHLVELVLSIKSSTPITQGTVATLNTRGVTGGTYVALKDNSTDLHPLVREPGQRYPVITSAPSLFMRLDTALQRLSNNLKKVSESIQSVLDQQNRRSIKEILINLEEVTKTLSNNSNHLTTIINNTAKVSTQFAPLVQSGQGAMRLLQTETLPAAYRLMTDLDEATRNLTQATNQIKRNPSVIIRGTAPTTLGPGEAR